MQPVVEGNSFGAEPFVGGLSDGRPGAVVELTLRNWRVLRRGGDADANGIEQLS